MSAAATLILLAGGLGGGAWLGGHLDRKRKEAIFDGFRGDGPTLTEVVSDPAMATVRGRWNGRAFLFRLTERPGGRHTRLATEAETEVFAPNLLLDLRPESADEHAAVARGEALDLRIGAADFDRAFIVEGAPRTAVERVLASQAVRDRLLALHPCRVSSEGGRVRLRKEGWIEDRAAMLAFVGALGSVAQSIERAERAERAGASAAAPGDDPRRGYRDGAPEAHAAHDELVQSGAELAALHALRDQRTRTKRLAQRTRAAIGLVVVAVLYGGALIAGHFGVAP